MNADDLALRVERWQQLSRGLAQEVARWKAGDDSLLPAERREYLDGIQDALAGADHARFVLTLDDGADAATELLGGQAVSLEFTNRRGVCRSQHRGAGHQGYRLEQHRPTRMRRDCRGCQ